jgi:hypothetical protein
VAQGQAWSGNTVTHLSSIRFGRVPATEFKKGASTTVLDAFKANSKRESTGDSRNGAEAGDVLETTESGLELHPGP